MNHRYYNILLESVIFIVLFIRISFRCKVFMIYITLRTVLVIKYYVYSILLVIRILVSVMNIRVVCAVSWLQIPILVQ